MNLSIFSCVTCACIYLRNHCLIQENENLFLYPLRVLQFSSYIQIMIHFGLIFIWCDIGDQLHSFHEDIQLSYTVCSKYYLFPLELLGSILKSIKPYVMEKAMAPHLPGKSHGQRSLVGCHLWGRTELDTTEVTQQQQQQPYVKVYFWTLSSIPLVYISILMPVLHFLDLCSKLWKSGSRSPPTLFFFKMVLAILGPLDFHVNFRTSLLVSAKKAVAILIRMSQQSFILEVVS